MRLELPRRAADLVVGAASRLAHGPERQLVCRVAHAQADPLHRARLERRRAAAPAGRVA